MAAGVANLCALECLHDSSKCSANVGIALNYDTVKSITQARLRQRSATVFRALSPQIFQGQLRNFWCAVKFYHSDSVVRQTRQVPDPRTTPINIQTPCIQNNDRDSH
jgi:hypothetical protein